MISNDFKLLFEAKQKLENEHKKLKTIIEQVKTEYQELYNKYQEVKKTDKKITILIIIKSILKI